LLLHATPAACHSSCTASGACHSCSMSLQLHVQLLLLHAAPAACHSSCMSSRSCCMPLLQHVSFHGCSMSQPQATTEIEFFIKILGTVTSVANPGCLYRIPDPTFFQLRIPDPNSLHPGSQILIKNLSIRIRIRIKRKYGPGFA
ncbi:MAG: hypothetical protein ACK53Y_01960, partial [bacterium]